MSTIPTNGVAKGVRAKLASSAAATRGRRKNLDALLSSSWMHWTTDDGTLERVHRLARPALDPCSNLASKTGALVEWFGTPENHHALAAAAAYKAAKDRPLAARQVLADQAGNLAAGGVRQAVDAARRAGRNAQALDGLAQSWQGFVSLVFVNPPYGREIAAWVEKCVREAELGAEIVLLVPARTDTAWFQDHVFETANAGIFWRGRIAFGNAPPGSEAPGATFPPFVGYWGRRVKRFLRAFEGAGQPCVLSKPKALFDGAGRRVEDDE